MAGWSSFNKYSLLGGLRSAAQMVSYEIPLTLSAVGVVVLAGTMSMNHIVLAQSGSVLDWFVFKQPLAALIFFIAATAEANRTPFDLTEADSEIVAGFATEYSGMRFGFFFFAEYVNVFIVSALPATLFFGGWTAPFNWPGPTTSTGFDPSPRHPRWFAIVLPGSRSAPTCWPWWSGFRRPQAGASGRDPPRLPRDGRWRWASWRSPASSPSTGSGVCSG